MLQKRCEADVKDSTRLASFKIASGVAGDPFRVSKYVDIN